MSSTHIEYDEEGRIIKRSNTFNPAYGTGDSVSEYKYDEAGNLVEQINRGYNINDKYEYFYMVG